MSSVGFMDPPAPVDGQTVKLITVNPNNLKTGGTQNNKFYNMTPNGDGTFTAEWGRIESTSSKKVYSMSKWDSTWRNKTKKGYKDQTHLFVDASGPVDFASIGDATVNRIVADLQAFANRSIKANYTVSSSAVTQKQIDEAQKLLDDIAVAVKMRARTGKINQALVELFHVIPRKMANVRDHVIDFGIVSDQRKLDFVNRLIAEEQAITYDRRGVI